MKVDRKHGPRNAVWNDPLGLVILSADIAALVLPEDGRL